MSKNNNFTFYFCYDRNENNICLIRRWFEFSELQQNWFDGNAL